MMRRSMAVGILLALALMLYAGPSPKAQTTATCDAVCQALINTPGYNFAPAAAPVVAGELQGVAVMSAAQNAQVALLQSAISALQSQVAAQAKELNLFRIYLSELCQRASVAGAPLQIPGTSTPCQIP